MSQNKKKNELHFVVLRHAVYVGRTEYRQLRERSWHHKIRRIAVLGNGEIIERR